MKQPDLIAEMMFGEGAIRCYGKFIMRPQNAQNKNLEKIDTPCTLMAGVMFPCVTDGPPDWEDEMWEVEVYIVPKKKYIHKKEGQFRGYRIDQLLTGGFADPEKWDEKQPLTTLPK